MLPEGKTLDQSLKETFASLVLPFLAGSPLFAASQVHVGGVR